jgi:2-amino-4-hydroxy-6-hydroxymethyldihydropteridine diphosphokinase
MNRATIGLGSNTGDRERLIRSALDLLNAIPGTRVIRASSLYDSEAAGDPDQPDYLNAAAILETDRAPRQLLWHLLLIEARLGRERRKRWGPRPIDLDLLFYDSRVIDEPDLTVPHPRILDRPFVLVPVDELAPNYVHPTAGRTIHELLKERKFSSSVRFWGRLW